jgi:chorismate-pyruvate lyase
MGHWQKMSAISNVPDVWLPWLSNTGSMTRLLEAASHAQCQVSVLREDWQEPWQDEGDELKLTSACCWVREVVLTTHKPVIFARSVFPRALIERFPQLTQLGSQPLGKTIFADNTFKRGDIEIAEINKEHLLWQQIPVALQKEKLWARRSVFHSQFGSFLLSEVFFSYVATL